MSRVVSIQQSEPGLYVVHLQRSQTKPIGQILESIANPPVDDLRTISSSNGMRPRYGERGGDRGGERGSDHGSDHGGAMQRGEGDDHS